MINLCVIPARGGSKGIPKKNIKMLCGKPLIAWTIEQALGAKCLDKVVVSTDDKDIASVAWDYGAQVHERSEKNSGDDVHAVHAIIECLDFYEKFGIIDNVAMLLATSPLRSSKDIDACFDILYRGECKSVVSVTSFDKPITSLRHLDEERDDKMWPIFKVDSFEVQRQEVKKPLYEVNGSIYVSTVKHLRRTESFHQGNPKAYKMPRSTSVDINTLDDWAIAEAILSCRK